METVSDTPNTDGAYVHESGKDFYEREVPSYEVGEVVAVAQRYEDLADIYQDKDSYLLQLSKVYGCNPEDVMKLPGWTNKMFVKSELMPRRIRITGIKCERLQDISDADCLKEGIFVNEYSDNGKKAIITGSMAFSMEPKDGLPEDGITLPAKPSPR